MASYNLMGYDAVGVTNVDLAGGLEFLLQMREKSKFAWLSANLVKKTSLDPILTPSIIREIGDITAGIIGITGAVSSLPFSAGDDARVLPWREVLPSLVAGLQKSCDLIVLLSNNDLNENEAIAKAIPGINIIIQAGTAGNNLPPRLVDNTLVCSTGKQGKYLGWLKIKWNDSHEWGVSKTELLAPKKAALDRLDWRLKRYLLKGDPAEVYKSEPAKLKTVHYLQEKREGLAGEIKKLESEIEMERVMGGAVSTFNNRFIAMKTTLPDQPDVLEIVRKTTETVNELGKNLTRQRRAMLSRKSSLRDKLPYTGWHTCAGCHAAQTEFWKSTRHSQAYQTLVDKRQNFNLDCLPCHVTPVRFDHERFDFAFTLPPDLLGVSCEGCHGPGKLHAANPGATRMVKTPAQEICLRCHTTKNDGAFDYDNDLTLIACPPAASQK